MFLLYFMSSIIGGNHDYIEKSTLTALGHPVLHKLLKNLLLPE